MLLMLANIERPPMDVPPEAVYVCCPFSWTKPPARWRRAIRRVGARWAPPTGASRASSSTENIGLSAIIPTPQPSRAAVGQLVPEPRARPRRRRCPAGGTHLPYSLAHRHLRVAGLLNRRSARRTRPSPVTGPGLAIREQGPPRAACHSARPGMARPRGALPPASCPAAWPPLSCGRCRPGSAIRPDAALGT